VQAIASGFFYRPHQKPHLSQSIHFRISNHQFGHNGIQFQFDLSLWLGISLKIEKMTQIVRWNAV